MNQQTHSEEAIAATLILDAIIQGGMRGAFLQDHEFQQLRNTATRMTGQERGKIIAALIAELNQIQPYNPSRQTQR